MYVHTPVRVNEIVQLMDSSRDDKDDTHFSACYVTSDLSFEQKGLVKIVQNIIPGTWDEKQNIASAVHALQHRMMTTTTR